MFRRLLIFTLFCAVAVAQKKSADKPLDPVQIDFTVTTPAGEFVPGLTAADFEVFQDDKSLKIVKAVHVPAPAARTVVLVVDDLGLTLDGLQQVQRALRKFVEQVQAGDRIAIIRTGVHNGLTQSFTSDRARLTEAIEGLNYNHHRDADAIGAKAFHSGTLLQLRFTMDALRKDPAHRAVVLLSERFTPPRGTDSEALEGVERSTLRIADMASEAMAIFYAIRVQPAQVATPPPPRIETGLAALVKETGGLWIDDAKDLTAALSRVLTDQSQYYLATVQPEFSAFDYTLGRERSDRYPKLAVKVSSPGVVVRARNTVYGPPDDGAFTGFTFASDEADDETAAFSPFDGGAIAIRSTPLFFHSAVEGPYVDVFSHVDLKRLTFTRGLNGEYKAAIGVMSMAFDSLGQTAGEIKRVVAISLLEDAFQTALEAGYSYVQRVLLRRPGAFQIRTAVRDEATGKIGSAGEYMEIPDVKSGELIVSGLQLRLSHATPQEPAAELRERTAVRTFKAGSPVSYTYQIYNLQTGADKNSRAALQVRLFRGGVLVFTGAPDIVPFDYSPQKTHAVTGTLRLGAEMIAGRYVLQIITTDKLSEKPQSATQFIDLEVRP